MDTQTGFALWMNLDFFQQARVSMLFCSKNEVLYDFMKSTSRMINFDFGFNQESSSQMLGAFGYDPVSSSQDYADYGLSRIDSLGLLISKLMIIGIFVSATLIIYSVVKLIFRIKPKTALKTLGDKLLLLIFINFPV